MAQLVNTEVRKALDAEIEELRGPLVSKLQQGMDNTLEVAKDSGAPNFISACERAEEPVATMVKMFKDLADVCEQYSTELKKVENVLGA